MPDAQTLQPQPPFARLLVDFGRELRHAGLPIGSGDVITYLAAMEPLDPTDMVDLYWAGRTTLVTKLEHIPVYDTVFRRFFLDVGDDLPEPFKLAMQAHETPGKTLVDVPLAEPTKEGHDEQEARLGVVASDTEILKGKSFTACTPEELAALRRIMKRMRLMPPQRRTRRHRSARSGRRPDPRRMVRESMRTHGEPTELFWRRRRVRLRPLILILDVSGSMADYSRSLLQFAHTARRSSARVEVFCFGSRLTRITRALERRRPDEALDRAAKAVVDWEGGTRIGESIDAFVRLWGRRGMSRGAIVVICSDGLDRGDPAVLGAAMERLSRLSRKVVWMNPHKGNNMSFQPSTLGMMVAAPFVDVMLSGHDLNSLEQLAELLPQL